MKKPVPLSNARARQIWLRAQRLDTAEPFGNGPQATQAAVEHLGYVQIDTINVIERCHHHILFTRIPGYQRAHLRQAQSSEKSVFEYWTHALAYVPARDLPFYLEEMKRHREDPIQWYADADPAELKKVVRRIRREGAISIRDVDDEPVEKDHLWASRKPTKKVLQLGFYNGELAISRRDGMLKSYELMDRHFGWPPRPKAATERQVATYKLDRALRSQGLINASSVLHQKIRMPPEVASLIETRVRKKMLVPVAIEGHEGTYWAEPAALQPPDPEAGLVHILSPFDPLIIQRRRTRDFFGYDHVFEAYVPKAKRRFGYFTLPVLLGDEIVAAIDLKTDRAAGKLLIQNWVWVGKGNPAEHQVAIDEALARFEAFQLGN